nr:hypothetical protein [uncultured Shimia sp.]
MRHWVFDQHGASGLIGRVASHPLTLQGAAPVYQQNYLTLPGLQGDALLSDTEDTSDIKDTLCLVFRKAAVAGISILGGTIDAVSGGAPFLSATQMFQTYRGALPSEPTGTVIEANQWYFLAVARDFSGPTKHLRLLLGGQPVVEVSGTGNYVPAPSGRKIAIGNGYYDSAANSPTDYAEAILFKDHAMSAMELGALHAFSKARMANKGINVT